ncbi:MAG TPA: D-amino acid dehydrogenase [Burkholderiales bacterium]|nr:D-amino acid dehydrogenase [Burkholderiales bacterium]
MKVLVLGAGVVGVTSAWYLAEAGHDVTVVDRQPIAGYETSFANGGQISVSHAEPWANPGAPFKILQWLGREDAPLLFRPRLSPRQWAWGLKFLYECLPGRTRRNTLEILKLALFSRNELHALRGRIRLRYEQSELGILHLHSDSSELEAARARVELMRSHGFEMELKTARQCVEIEPALKYSRTAIAGGTYSPSDESGDAHQFSRQLEEACRRRGVTLLFQTTVQRLLREGQRVTGARVRHVEGPEELLRADAYLVCLGSYTPFLVEPLGVHVAVYPVKGYSVTVPIKNHEAAPRVCLTDESAKLAISRLGDRLRVAGTAELNAYDTSTSAARCNAILDRAEALFPDAADYWRAQFWAGLRPATPSNVPVIGHTALTNLFLNTGHGTLGWTLACGSARAIANIIGDRPPGVDFPFT